MGVQTKTVKTVTCDMCNRACHETDDDIVIRVNGGDGRDVGPATIDGSIHFNQPYGVQGGLICIACKAKWLNRYVKTLEKDLENMNTEPAK